MESNNEVKCIFRLYLSTDIIIIIIQKLLFGYDARYIIIVFRNCVKIA